MLCAGKIKSSLHHLFAFHTDGKPGIKVESILEKEQFHTGNPRLTQSNHIKAYWEVITVKNVNL